MMDAKEYEVVKLFFSEQKWVVSYQGDTSLQYEYYEDAVISLGILARELSKVIRHPLRILMFSENAEVQHENFFFPSLYDQNQNKKMKKMFRTL